MEAFYKKFLKIGGIVIIVLFFIIILLMEKNDYYEEQENTMITLERFSSADGIYDLKITRSERTRLFVPTEIKVEVKRKNGGFKSVFSTQLQRPLSTVFDVAWTDEGVILTISGKKEAMRSYLLLWEYVFEKEDDL